MISKQIKGKDFYGVLMYNHKKVLAGVASIIDSNVNKGTVVQQTKEFNLVRQLRPNLSKAVYHTSLNLSYSDTLTDEEFSNLARDYLESMGFNDNQFIIFKHWDQDHLHIHLVANRVKFSGEVVSDSQDYKRSEALVRKLELKYKLTQFLPKQETNVLSRGEIEKCIRTGDLPERLELQSIIFEILNENISLQLFIKKLKARGVETKLNNSSTGYISGISFEFKEIAYKGSAVHKALSWKNIDTKLKNYEQNRNNSIVPEIDTGIRASKENAIGVENRDSRFEKNKHQQSSDHKQEANSLNRKKIEIKSKKTFRL